MARLPVTENQHWKESSRRQIEAIPEGGRGRMVHIQHKTLAIAPTKGV